MIFEVVVETVMLKILADDDLLPELPDNPIPDPMIGTDIGKFLDPTMNGTLRGLHLEPAVDQFDRLFNRISEIVIGDCRSNHFRLVRFVGEPILSELFPAIFAEVDLAGAEFEPGGSFLDHMFASADWTFNGLFHLLDLVRGLVFK